MFLMCSVFFRLTLISYLPSLFNIRATIANWLCLTKVTFLHAISGFFSTELLALLKLLGYDLLGAQ